MGIPAQKQPKVLIKPSENGYDSTDPSGENQLRIVGKIENGSNLIIRSPVGMFGDKEQQSTPVYDSFDYADGALLKNENPNWVSYLSNDGALITSDFSRSGGKSAINTSDRPEFSTNYVQYPPSREVFASYWFRFEADLNGGDDSDYAIGKLCRISSSQAVGGGGVYNGKGMVMLNTMNPRYESSAMIVTDAGTQTTLGYLNVPYNEWVRINIYGKHSTMNNTDGRVWVQSIGTDIEDHPNISTAAEGEESIFDTLLLGLMMANVQGDGMVMMIDEIYIDRGQNALARIELCESTSWSDNAKKEIQPYISWSDDSITITQNHGSLSGECGLFFVPESGEPVLISAINLGA